MFVVLIVQNEDLFAAINLAAQSQVADFDVTFEVDQYILWLEV